MKFLKLLIASVILLTINNCSTISVSKQAADLSSIKVNKTYQLRVRSGNLAIDKLIYESASAGLGRYLQINNKEPYSGFIDIVFTSSSKQVSSSKAGYVNNVLYGNLWYTGNETPGLSNAYRTSGAEITPGGPFTWQDSLMVVTIREIEGRTLWTAQYNYKGGSELALMYVNSSDDAARISLERIIKQFEKDFIFIPKTENKAQGTKPPIALIIEKQSPAASAANSIPEETGSLVK